MKLVVEPIGFVRSPFRDKASAPRQAVLAKDELGVIELERDRGFEDALDGLSTFDHLWVLFWFHDHDGSWRPKVQPPRSEVKRGLFATRSPHRPNPIGMSAVRLERIEGLSIFVRGIDMVEGTPVLDIKPYVPYADAVPDASHGWLHADADPGPRYAVAWSEEARRAVDWIDDHSGAALRGRVEVLLGVGPEPHAYRRIKKIGGGRAQIAVTSWRFTFVVEGSAITVLEVSSGYRPSQLAAPVPGEAPELALHRAFVAQPWGTHAAG